MLQTSDGSVIPTRHFREVFGKPNLDDVFKIFIFDACRTQGKKELT